MLWKWMRPNGDFQDLPSWRELVVAAALSLRRHHVDAAVDAAARQPAGTLMLRSDRLTPAELADEVLAAADSRQVH